MSTCELEQISRDHGCTAAASTEKKWHQWSCNLQVRPGTSVGLQARNPSQKVSQTSNQPHQPQKTPTKTPDASSPKPSTARIKLEIYGNHLPRGGARNLFFSLLGGWANHANLYKNLYLELKCGTGAPRVRTGVHRHETKQITRCQRPNRRRPRPQTHASHPKPEPRTRHEPPQLAHLNTRT